MDNEQTNEDNQQDKSFENQDNKQNNDVSTAQTDPKSSDSNVVPPEPQPQITTKPVHNSPGVIILQWLTYAFWGGTVIAMSTLTALVLTFFLIKGAETGEPSLYVMATVLVLLPISVICDFFYMKQEPEKKTGFPSVVMIIHAILFALIGVGSLVVIAYLIMNLLISSSDNEGTLVALYSALITAFLFAILFLRTLLPKKLFKMRRYFIIIMVIIVGAICAFGIFGPVAEARLTRNDTLIEHNLSTVSEAVDKYATTNKQLPEGLSSLKLTGDAKKLVTDNLVTYKKDSAPIIQKNNLDYTSEYPSSENFYYQLCATYQKASNEMDEYNSDIYSSGSEYDTYPSTYSHPAGEECYKLMTNNDNYDYVTQ